jgi:REP element-mobilizing transposase RayT
MNNYQEVLLPDCFYHVYNRTNGHDLLFRNNSDYIRFIQKYKKYIPPIAQTYCYCLLPNHFHYLIKMNDKQTILENMEKTKSGRKLRTKLGISPVRVSNATKSILTDQRHPDRAKNAETILSNYLSNQFSRLFNSYTQLYNYMHNRHGSLFQRPFKRKRIEDENYLTKLIHYIHYNPVKAGLCSNIEEWNYSSYKAIIMNKNTLIIKNEVIHLFGDHTNFMYCHKNPPDITGIDNP